MITHNVTLPRAGTDYDTLAACLYEMAQKWQAEAEKTDTIDQVMCGLTITEGYFRFAITTTEAE